MPYEEDDDCGDGSRDGCGDDLYVAGNAFDEVPCVPAANEQCGELAQAAANGGADGAEGRDEDEAVDDGGDEAREVDDGVLPLVSGGDEVLGQDGVQGDEQEGWQDAQEGDDGGPVLAAAEYGDDGIGTQRGAGDACGGEQEHEVDVLDEQAPVLVLGIFGVVGQAWEHDVDDGVDGHDEHGLDFGDELVDADDVVGGEEAEDHHVGLRVHARGDAGHEEGSHGPEMPSYVKLVYGHERDESAQAEHVEDVGPVSGEHDDHAVDAVVGRLVHEGEHEYEADELDRDAADGDVSVLFDGLIEPFHAEGCKPQRDAEDEEERLVLGEPWYDLQGGEVEEEDDGGGDGEDDEELFDGAGELLPVVPDLGACSHPIHGYTEHGREREIGNDALRERDRTHARRIQYAGNIWDRDQRKHERRRHENHVHQRIKLQRTNTHNKYQYEQIKIITEANFLKK